MTTDTVDTVRELADGVWRITTPMPHRPRQVHAYLVEPEDGTWFLLDGGVDSGEAWTVLDRAVRRLAGSWDAVGLNIISHMHLDHIGLAGRVAAASDAPLAMGALDALRHAHARREPQEEADYRADLLLRAGAPSRLAPGAGPAPVAASTNTSGSPPGSGSPDTAARGGAPTHAGRAPGLEFEIHLPMEDAPLPGVPGWRVIWTPGHTAGHISLLREHDRLLLAGDAVLPRITPTIGVNRQREDPVGDYLGALAALAELRPTLALCGHGDPIHQPLARIRTLARATADETERVVLLLDSGGRTPWQVTERIYASRDLPAAAWMQALRETLAHLEHARLSGRAERSRRGDVSCYSAR